MTTYESEIKTISRQQEVVFNLLSDLNNLKAFQENAAAQDNEKFKEYVKDIEFDSDKIMFSTAGVGRVGFRIIEREPCKTIKMETENSPIAANAWIQLLPYGESETKIKVTIKAELPMMVKMMVDSKLKKGVNAIADVIAEALNRQA